MKLGTTINIIDNTATTRCECSVTGDVFTIKVNLQKWMDWRMGELIQKAFPELEPHEREMMQTGITPAEWDEMFSV